MQNPEQPPLAEPVIPLAYSSEAAPASEMVWIVRFIAVYVLVQALSQLAPIVNRIGQLVHDVITMGQLVEKMTTASLLNVIWDTLWNAGSIVASLMTCSAILIAIALWRLRREAFWALLVGCALPSPYIMMSSISSWLFVMPAAIMAMAVVFLIYRRATLREALRPDTLRQNPTAPDGPDMTWFMGIVGLWALIPAVSYLCTWAMTPITGLYGFAFRDLIATQSVSAARIIVMAGIGAILIARRTHRILPLLAATFLLAGIGSDVAIRWDLSHNPRSAVVILSSYSGSVHGIMMCCFTIMLYRRARQHAQACSAPCDAALHAT